MRGLGLFFGVASRNDPVRLSDPHPLTNYGDDVEKGNAGLDGFTVLSRADPRSQGSPPLVNGALGRAYQGPDQSFEQ
jgi:hypothetical protein